MYRHLTIEELVRHCAVEPGHLVLEGELVRRVIASEVEISDQDLIKELNATVDEKVEEINRLDTRLADKETELDTLQDKIDVLLAKIHTASKVLLV